MKKTANQNTLKIALLGSQYSGKLTFIECLRDLALENISVSYIERLRYLFRFDSALSCDLDQERIPPVLRSEFIKKEGLYLSEKAVVRVLQPNLKWELYDSEVTYVGVSGTKEEKRILERQYLLEKKANSIYVSEDSRERYDYLESLIEIKNLSKRIVVQWTNMFFYSNDQQYILSKDVDGIMFIFNPLRVISGCGDGFTLNIREIFQDETKERRYYIGSRSFSESFLNFFKVPCHQFPIVFCYNHADKLKSLDKDQQEQILDFIKKMEKQGEIAGEIAETAAPPLIQKFLLALNKLLNPYNHPWFVTSAIYGYNVEAAFLKLIELVEKREGGNVS